VEKSDLSDGAVEKVAGGFQFVEGPVWHPEGYLLFSDIPGDRINKLTPEGAVSVHREPSGNSNGLTFDAKARLIACEHGNRRVSRTGADGSVETIAAAFNGKKLNSPNDVVMHSSGAVYFTDPPYGIKPEQQEQPCAGVYRLDLNGELKLLVDDFLKPNGLGFSPDESVLYIDDSERQHVRAFDVLEDGSLANGRLFADVQHSSPGAPDGLKIDQEGNVYVTNSMGMWTYAADGTFRGLLAVPEVPANCAWGEDGKTLFMTARTSVYKVRMKIAGIAVL
jgi:gluconolactonase